LIIHLFPFTISGNVLLFIKCFYAYRVIVFNHFEIGCLFQLNFVQIDFFVSQDFYFVDYFNTKSGLLFSFQNLHYQKEFNDFIVQYVKYYHAVDERLFSLLKR